MPLIVWWVKACWIEEAKACK